MTEPASAALAAAARVRVSVIVGAGDTGKTSLAAGLARALVAGGARVAVVDADVGQSEIGPPTTVGLGAVTGPLVRLRDARLLALAFIGDTSPVRHIAETADATGRLVRRALAEGFTHVLVDTGGLVEGALGLALKRAKVRAVDPDLVLVVERRGESEPLVRALGGGARPTVVRVPASPAATRRTPTERRRHRDAALRDYLAAASAVEVALERVRAGRGAPAAPAAGQLAGVYGDEGEALGVGRVQSVDRERGWIVIATPVEAARVATVRLGRAVWPAAT
jgi:polynucleotide 5'-hydroxyl-kinase GRC3/NOL9